MDFQLAKHMHLPHAIYRSCRKGSGQEERFWQSFCGRMSDPSRGEGSAGLIFFRNEFVGFETEIKLKPRMVKFERVSHPRCRLLLGALILPGLKF